MAGDITSIWPVVYMGGTCGDLVSALIDPKDTVIDIDQAKVDMVPIRQRFKKPHTFANDSERDEYLESMTNKYLSLPSHDIEYHTRKQHRLVGIRVTTPRLALWAAKRFKYLHRAQVWDSVQQQHEIDTVEDYAQLLMDYGSVIHLKTELVIDLEDILSGTVVVNLEHLLACPLSRDAVNYYKSWRRLQNVEISQ